MAGNSKASAKASRAARTGARGRKRPARGTRINDLAAERATGPAATAAGIRAAVEAVGAGEPPKPAEQLALMPLPAIGGAVTLDDAPEGPNRGPGRPPGARNKRTEEWIGYLSSRYRSPLVVLAEIYSRPTEEIARALQCKKAEAFGMQLEAAKQSLPYWHQKLPQAIEIEGRNLVGLTLIVQDAPAAAEPPTEIARVIEHQPNQQLSAKPKGRVGRKGVGQ